MKHKLLFLCALFVGASISSAPAIASGPGVESVKSAAPTSQAMLTLGVRYRIGGRSPLIGFDCSGLVTHVFEQAWGMVLPHNAQAQSQTGIPIKLEELEPGDLVFYNTRNRPYSHVGIYLGDGRFIHAPRPGKHVRVENFLSAYWRGRFNGARRLIPPV